MSLTSLNPFASRHDLPAVALDTDTVLDAIGNDRRRFVLAYLYDAGEPVTLDELTNERAAIEAGPTPSCADRKRVYIAFYQVHLKRLDEMGAIHYDRARGIVEPSEHTDALAEWGQAAKERAHGASEAIAR